MPGAKWTARPATDRRDLRQDRNDGRKRTSDRPGHATIKRWRPSWRAVRRELACVLRRQNGTRKEKGRRDNPGALSPC